MTVEKIQETGLLRPSEAAQLLHVHVKTLTRWEIAGRISAVRTLGGHRRYRADEVAAILSGWRRAPEGPGREGDGHGRP